MAVPVDIEGSFSFGNAAELFDSPYAASNVYRTYDVTADGQRSVMIKDAGGPDDPETEPESPRINVVVNWIEELKRRVPTE